MLARFMFLNLFGACILACGQCILFYYLLLFYLYLFSSVFLWILGMMRMTRLKFMLFFFSQPIHNRDYVYAKTEAEQYISVQIPADDCNEQQD